jgi:hypothetical protein
LIKKGVATVKAATPELLTSLRYQYNISSGYYFGVFTLASVQ